MARIRAIKIGFFENEDLGALTPWHRLLYEGLWLIADREGRLEDRPARIKAQVFPYDAAFPYVTDDGTIKETSVDAMLTDLARRGAPPFLTRYEVDGRRYVQIDPVAWKKHQRPKVDEARSTIPPPPTTGEDPTRTRDDPRGSTRTRDNHRAEGEREGEGEREERKPSAGDEPPAEEAVANPVAATLALYDTLYRAQFAVPAPIVRGKDAKLVRGLVARYGAADVEAHLRRFFTSTDPFIQRSGYSLGIFATCIGKLLVEANGPPRADPRPFTSQELRAAQDWRRAIGHCPHDPACDSYDVCLGEYMRTARARRQGEAVPA